VDLPGVDWLLSFGLPSLLFTAFAIGGIANAINIIDGVHGLASGSAILILSGFALVAWQVGDTQILGIALVSIGSLAGFFLLNFPMGRIFLGDAGAYTVGFLLAVLAVMLPARNAELSPLIGLLALAYPVTETLVSIHRRMVRKGAHPGRPDRLHLHSLIYRSRARRLAQSLDSPHLRNALSGLLMMGLPLLSSGLMVMFGKDTGWTLSSLVAMVVVYLTIYRKVALLNRRGLHIVRGRLRISHD
jgi:UDP-N-acetylmuramyl pentapeptide phosphotransferase/UDP-N-acetylglucosamine-1-phosphate transferase